MEVRNQGMEQVNGAVYAFTLQHTTCYLISGCLSGRNSQVANQLLCSNALLDTKLQSAPNGDQGVGTLANPEIIVY